MTTHEAMELIESLIIIHNQNKGSNFQKPKVQSYLKENKLEDSMNVTIHLSISS